MNTALEHTVVSDRLVAAVCNEEQQARYSVRLLPAREFRDQARQALLQDLLEYPVCPHISAKDFNAPEESFKVLERAEGLQGLTAEQFQSLKDIQARCAAGYPGAAKGLLVVREAVPVEKFVVSGEKTLKVIPLVLITVTAADPQARCPALVFTRRVML